MYARRGLNYIARVERDFAIWKELTIDFRGRTVWFIQHIARRIGDR
jgi:hypothetical protein